MRRLAVLDNISDQNSAIDADTAALARAKSASVVVLVEGISDQMAVQTLADRRGRDLEAERVVIVAMGGAHAIARHLGYLGQQGREIAVAGMCDAGEEAYFRRAVASTGRCHPKTRGELEQCGFYVCVKDLEDELIRAVDNAAIEDLLDDHRDLGSFRTLQKQREWRDQAFAQQFHRWLRAGASRNVRYARLLVLTADDGRIPRPLDGVLAAARSGLSGE